MARHCIVDDCLRFFVRRHFGIYHPRFVGLFQNRLKLAVIFKPVLSWLDSRNSQKSASLRTRDVCYSVKHSVYANFTEQVWRALNFSYPQADNSRMKWKQLDALSTEQRAYLLEYSAQWPFARIFRKMLIRRAVASVVIFAFAIGMAAAGVHIGFLALIIWGLQKLFAVFRLASLGRTAKGRDDIMVSEAYRTIERLKKVEARRGVTAGL